MGLGRVRPLLSLGGVVLVLSIAAMVAYAAIWIAMIAVAYKAMKERGRSGVLGAALALFFGPLGTIVALLMPRTIEAEALRQLDISDAVRDLEEEFPLRRG